MQTISRHYGTLAYDDLGPDRATPLLLVHGHPFDRSMWRPQLRAFGAQRRVMVPDLRGYGASAGAVPEWRAFADDLAFLLDALRVPRAVVVGLSMGGQIALEFWARHPGRVAGLLLADTTAADETAESRRDRLAQADRLLAEGMDPYAVDVLYRMVTPDAPADVAEHVLTMMRDTDPAGAAAAQRARADRPDHRTTLGTITVPTTVVVGARDVFTPPAEAESIAAAVPGARLVVVDGAAHLPNLENPGPFDDALAELLARADAATTV
ncbi:alpha/beta fold hydrolase [Pseudonocardia nigra]|uniref:alpha/beta fold hydrolase n=1 Tax=Pseudonocardia nigra TaxID=1921578 RepID=UPI001C5DBF7F|nr:alpha/beta fold hydrolase [Pseudonocardia nigra]